MWQHILKSAISVADRIGLLDKYSILRRGLARPSATILTYHRVRPPITPWYLDALDPDCFERGIAYLRKVGEIMPLDLLVSKIARGEPLPYPIIAITFDDGYKDNYEYAYPILRKYDVPATIYLTTGFIDGASMIWADKVYYTIWNTNMQEFEINGLGKYTLRTEAQRLSSMRKVASYLNEVPEAQKILLIDELTDVLKVDIPEGLGKALALSWEEVREMNQNGITFGAHTVSHPILTKLPIDEAKYEINRSKKDIEQELGQPVTSFAYPNGSSGDFNTEIIELVKASGFMFAVTGIPGFLTPSSEPYLLGRIPSGWNYPTFKAWFSGLHPDLVALKNRLKG